MKTVCFYFQVHQPFRMRNYHILDIGKNHHYFDDKQNREIIRKVAEKCYLPTNRLIAKLIRRHKRKFRVSYSVSGVALEQMEKYAPEVIDSFRDLVSTGGVEMLGETYYHSLSAVYSKDEFERQVNIHREKLNQLFGFNPTSFRNTELIYSDHLAWLIQKMGFQVVMAEGVDWLIGENGAGKIWRGRGTDNLKILLRNYRLSDDIGFRFSSPDWSEHPLFADKWASWVNASPGPIINIFIDYETFGEHQWASTGIFEFLDFLPKALLSIKDLEILTPSQVAEKYPAQDELVCPNWISWADTERDLSAWLGNPMQRNAMDKLYSLEKDILASGDFELICDWRKLSTSDHYYYMSTKYAADAEVHKYFNPHHGPHFAYIVMMRILSDLEERLNR